MIRTKKIKSFYYKIIDELLLYSGQYALFYIIMNFSKDGLSYFDDFGHTALIFILLIQTIFLVFYGNTFRGRFLGSLIAPMCYSFIEFNIDLVFLSNSAHIMFWILSALTGLVQAVQRKDNISIKIKKLLDFSNNMINIFIFIFLYYYFDLYLALKEELLSGLITESGYIKMMHINSTIPNLIVFLEDSAHVYIIIAGLLLAISLGVGRIKVIVLTEKIKMLFGKYVDEDIRDKIILEGRGKSQKLKLAVMFIDIRNFTNISENSSPEEITMMLNYFFDTIAKDIKSNNGIIDKFIGDGVMAIFGLKDIDTGCNSAHKCAVNILKKVPGIKLELSRLNLPVLEDIGIGIHYGDLIAGDIGSSDRVNYTFIGDTVNVSSRIESSCKKLDSMYVVSSEFYTKLNQLNRNVFCASSKNIFVKGKEDALKVFTYKIKNLQY